MLSHVDRSVDRSMNGSIDNIWWVTETAIQHGMHRSIGGWRRLVNKMTAVVCLAVARAGWLQHFSLVYLLRTCDNVALLRMFEACLFVALSQYVPPSQFMQKSAGERDMTCGLVIVLSCVTRYDIISSSSSSSIYHPIHGCQWYQRW